MAKPLKAPKASKKSAKSKALEKLVERNFSAVNKKELKKRKRASKPPSDSAREPLEPYEERDEIKSLKKELGRSLLAAQPAYTKRARMVHPEYSFEGLTPGLAPVGYDPDESDEDPF